MDASFIFTTNSLEASCGADLFWKFCDINREKGAREPNGDGITVLQGVSQRAK
jgi:hypothetical protein